jgi:predicted lipoprotein with Yx(FWY)xxD motif
MLRTRFVALAIGAVLLGACAEQEPTVAPPTEDTATATAPAGQATVDVADSEFGEILADAEGRTLYVFMRDTAGKSSCTGACVSTWSPLEADGKSTAGEGVESAKLGTTERSDGKSQVTYNDRPLYHYSGDSKAGDTNGQGIGGNWYVVSPEGEPIKE